MPEDDRITSISDLIILITFRVDTPFLEFFVSAPYGLAIYITVSWIILFFIVSVEVEDVVGSIQTSVSHDDRPFKAKSALCLFDDRKHVHFFGFIARKQSIR